MDALEVLGVLLAWSLGTFGFYSLWRANSKKPVGASGWPTDLRTIINNKRRPEWASSWAEFAEGCRHLLVLSYWPSWYRRSPAGEPSKSVPSGRYGLTSLTSLRIVLSWSP